jgi:hypothetical protein
VADNCRYIPGVPKREPEKTVEERAREAHLRELYERANTPEYQRELAANRAFNRMVDLIEGKVTR